VKGVAPGKVKITATHVPSKLSDFREVTVNASAVAVTGVSVSPKTLTLEAGKKQTLTATVAPSTATVKTVTWASNNAAAATVNATTGEVTAVDAGKGTATITATTTDGSKTDNCVVTVSAITTTLTVTVAAGTYTYNGAEQKPAATVKAGETTLTPTTDYTLAYSANINAGTAATVTATGTGNYAGSTGSGTFTIAPNATALTVTVSGSYTYNGAAQTPPAANIAVKAGETTLAAAGYSLAYENNTAAGTAAKVTATATGNYSGTGSGVFTIAKFAVNVKANDMGKAVDEADPPLTYTVTPALFSPDAFTGALTREAGEVLGASYAITQG
jgi:hypothetical protein